MRVLAIVHQRDAGPGVFARVVAAQGHELEQWRPSEEPEPPRSDHHAVMVFGGAMNAGEEARHPWLKREKALVGELAAAAVPVLGVCLGAQLLAEAAGGRVRRAAEPEIGWREVTLEPAASGDPLLNALPDRFETFQWHSYEAVPPPGASVLARSAVCPQAFRLEDRPAWGIQFHAEVTLEGAEAWIEGYRSDPDAAGIDAAAFASETREAIARWNEVGQALCARFLDVAAARPVTGLNAPQAGNPHAFPDRGANTNHGGSPGPRSEADPVPQRGVRQGEGAGDGAAGAHRDDHA